jgi:aldehyde:ferredoxin oxidoreductase
MKLGEKILKEKYKFKLREGFDFNNLRIPSKILEIESPLKKIKRETIEEAIKLYADRVKA